MILHDSCIVLVGREYNARFLAFGDEAQTLDHELDHAAFLDALAVTLGTGAEAGHHVNIHHLFFFKHEAEHVLELLGIHQILDDRIGISLGTGMHSDILHGQTLAFLVKTDFALFENDFDEICPHHADAWPGDLNAECFTDLNTHFFR